VARQATDAILFDVVDGPPVNPWGPTGTATAVTSWGSLGWGPGRRRDRDRHRRAPPAPALARGGDISNWPPTSTPCAEPSMRTPR